MSAHAHWRGGGGRISSLFVKKAVLLVAAQTSVRNSWKVYWSWHVVSITFYVNVINKDKFEPVIIQLPLLLPLSSLSPEFCVTRKWQYETPEP